ncbi:hypothetical protein [Kutzneria sp. NPDC052558]|uniref:hypothetical protein n=1 Tax=Kutzneria sp. NPDC052558 TaxID=3364121 RepID=UPI0037C8D663
MSAGTVPELEPLQPSLARPVAEVQLADLCERFESLCANAVDPLEIAAGLEAEGFSDQSVRVGFGFPDVFALAEDLHRRVPPSPAEPAPQPDPWRTSVWRHALRGLLFGLPSLCYPVAAPLLSTVDAVPLLVVSTIVSWALSQGLSYLGYARLGNVDRDGARRVLRLGLLGALVLLLAVVGLGAALAGRIGPATVFAAGQGGYLLAATVLFVDRGERWLVAGLAPGVLAGAVFLALGAPDGLRGGALAAVAGTPLLTLGFALGRTSWPAPKAATALRWTELRATWPYLAFGAIAAGLLAFPLIAMLLVPSTAGGASNAMLAALPLSLSMGAAEWLLHRYRSGTRRLLQRTRRVEDFAARSWWQLVSTVAWYLLCTGVLMAATRELGAAVGISPQWTGMLAYAACLVLGGTLFLALLLQAFSGPAAVLPWAGGALAAEVGYVMFDRTASVLRVQLLVCGGLLIALVLRAGVVLDKPARHR